MAQDTYDPDERADYGSNGGYGGFGGGGFGGGRPGGYGGDGDDTVRFNASEDGPIRRTLGAGDDVVRVSADDAGQVRLSFTSTEVGNGATPMTPTSWPTRTVGWPYACKPRTGPTASPAR